MRSWLELLSSRVPSSSGRRRAWLHRKVHLGANVVEWLHAPERDEVERFAFAELLLKLDSDPISHSLPILRPGAPAGMRWAPFGARKAIFILDIGGDEIRIISCV